MGAERQQRARKAAISKFATPDPQKLTDEAVERELKRIRPQYNLTDADLRRLRRLRRRHAL